MFIKLFEEGLAYKQEMQIKMKEARVQRIQYVDVGHCDGLPIPKLSLEMEKCFADSIYS